MGFQVDPHSELKKNNRIVICVLGHETEFFVVEKDRYMCVRERERDIYIPKPRERNIYNKMK